MSDEAKKQPIRKRGVNPWLVAAVVVVPTFMEVLDTTIANVALRYIAGGLSAPEVDAEWVITSYLAANATVLPISGWIMARVGRRRYFLISMTVFTLASALCGMAGSLLQIILFRILQGLAGGGLQPSSQGILLDKFPPEKQGTAQTLFGIAALIAPIVGPTLGGYLCDNYNWRWIFLINIPIGILATVAAYYVVEDPNYLKEECEKNRCQPLRFDLIGVGLLVLIMASWETVLSKGQEWDWLGDPFWRIQTLVIVFVVALPLFILRELKTEHPLVNLRVLGERNFTLSCIILFSSFAVLYAASIQLPAMLQLLFGYDAYRAGLVLSPGGFSSISIMLVASYLMFRKFDVRWLIATGLLCIAASNYMSAHLNLEIGPWQAIFPRMVLTAGVGFIFAPINVAAYKYIPQHLRGAAVGVANLLRNEGGSVGTSMSQTMQERREQFHLSRLGDHLSDLNPLVHSTLDELRSYFEQFTGDPVGSQLMAVQQLANLRQQQAASLAYFDVFWITSILPLVLIFLVFFMKPSAPAKGR